MLLYKYRNWPAKGENWTKAILESGNIWASAPEDFNDPYDGKFDVFSTKFQADLDEVIATMHSMSFYLGYLSDASDRLSKEEKARLLKKYESFHSVNEAFNFVKSYLKSKGIDSSVLTTGKEMIEKIKNQTSSYGIFCMAEEYNNILMWSHYGDQHKGIALGFEIDDKMLDEKTRPYCRKVEYTDEFPTLSPDEVKTTTSFKFGDKGITKELRFDDKGLIAQKPLYTKAMCWEYEKEWRIIYDKSGSQSFPGELKEIVFGCRATSETISEVKKVVRKHIRNNVKYHYLRMASDAFSLSY